MSDEKTEIWKDVVGYEGIYHVSNLGRVKRHDITWKHEHILKPRTNYKNRGYPMVVLSKNNIKHSFVVHRLVAKAFIPNPNNYPEINHINGIKNDNRVENLEWCTHIYNRKEADRLRLYPDITDNKLSAKLTVTEVIEIYYIAFFGILPSRYIGTLYNVSGTSVNNITNGKRWKIHELLR